MILARTRAPAGEMEPDLRALRFASFDDREIPDEVPVYLTTARDEDGVLVGYALLTEQYGAEIVLEEVAVPEQRRGARIGTTLVEEAKRWAGSLGFGVLIVAPVMVNRRSFFERLGFQPHESQSDAMQTVTTS